MSASAAYAAVVKMTGAAATLTSEPLSYLSGSGTTKTYAITDTTKNVLNPSATLVVKDDAATISSALYVIDYLFGRVIFLNYTLLGALTISGTNGYFIMWAVTTAKGFKLKDSYTELGSDVLGSAGAKTRIMGERDMSGSLNHLDTGHDVYGGSVTIIANMARGAVLLELTPIVSGPIARVWSLFSKDELESSPDALAQGTVSWVQAARGLHAGGAWSNE